MLPIATALRSFLVEVRIFRNAYKIHLGQLPVNLSTAAFVAFAGSSSVGIYLLKLTKEKLEQGLKYGQSYIVNFEHVVAGWIKALNTILVTL